MLVEHFCISFFPPHMVTIFFLVMRNFKIYSVSNFKFTIQCYSIQQCIEYKLSFFSTSLPIFVIPFAFPS